MDLYRILKQAYNFGRDNGSGRSEKNLNDFIEKPEIKQLLIQSVSQRSELFADQDSKEFVLWQGDREIHRESNDCYKWREFKYNRNFFLEKYQEDLNKANCG